MEGDAAGGSQRNYYASDASEIASVHSGAAYSQVGQPTFVTNQARSDFIAFLNGSNLPYLLVVNHPRKAKIELDSELELNGSNLFVRNTITIDGTELISEHGLGPGVLGEYMIVDSIPIDLTAGRIIECGYENGIFKMTRQHKTTSIPSNLVCRQFRLDHPSDRVKPIVMWWRNFLHNETE